MDWINVPPLKNIQLAWQVTCARFREWLEYELFSLQWWILLALLVISVFLWWKLVDRKRLTEITLYNSIIILFILMLDELGLEMMLWYYPVDLFFLFPPTTAVNIICMPLVYMLIYQYCRTWKSFIVATVLMAVVFCFVIEPIFVRLGAYVMLKWKSYYGLPIYVAIALLSKLIVSAILSASAKQQRRKTAG